ncbi:calcium-binding protein [Moorena sp. SIO4G3]|uniref:calcium-binding protein n=1 Tax=Moorena sp. SIO4G3 TaxID=2607821 RepID=UPI00142CA7D3|nr:calcium-binding protein [Moorena sp. SIO4G3]NEO80231.1 calcium-binding protein [Moorena sp. SIO4G3]
MANPGNGDNNNNNLCGDSSDNSIFGFDGDDTIKGEAGNDTLYGGTGNDFLDGGSGNDYLFDDLGDDSMYGGAGNDYFDGGSGNDSMYGGTGDDTYVVNSPGDVVTENPNEGIDTIISSIDYTLEINPNVEKLILTESAHYGYGNTLDNTIVGKDNNNVLSGNSGNDDLYGNGGNDILSGGFGNDSLFGGLGKDLLIGDPGNDLLIGDLGNDSLFGYSGNDSLFGDSGNDTLQGYKASSQGELDILTGGTGADTFVLGKNAFGTEIGYFGDYNSGYAKITDFNGAEGDKVQLGGSEADIDNAIYTLSGNNLLYNGDLIAVFQGSTDFDINNSAHVMF